MNVFFNLYLNGKKKKRENILYAITVVFDSSKKQLLLTVT